MLPTAGRSALWEQLRIHSLNFSFPHSSGPSPPPPPRIILSLFQLGRAMEIWNICFLGLFQSPHGTFWWNISSGVFVCLCVCSFYVLLLLLFHSMGFYLCGSPNRRVSTAPKSVGLIKKFSPSTVTDLFEGSRWKLFFFCLLPSLKLLYTLQCRKITGKILSKIFHLGRYKLCHTSCSHELSNTFFCPCGCLNRPKCWPKAHSVMGLSSITADIGHSSKGTWSWAPGLLYSFHAEAKIPLISSRPHLQNTTYPLKFISRTS